MILSKGHIKKALESGEVIIDPVNSENLNPNSYDLTLGNKIAWYPVLENNVTVPQIAEDIPYDRYGMASVTNEANAKFARIVGYLDPAKDNMMIEKTIPKEGIVLLPHILYLCMVNETLWSDKYVFELTGKSTLARLGIIVHHTAGYSNLGHMFKYVLEIQVVHPVRIYPNMKIAQVYIHEVKMNDDDINVGYNGGYEDRQTGSHICPPNPIRGFDDVVNTRPSVSKIAVTSEDIANYHKIKSAGDLTVQEDGTVTSDKFMNVSSKVVPHAHKDGDGNDIVSTIEFTPEE